MMNWKDVDGSDRSLFQVPEQPPPPPKKKKLSDTPSSDRNSNSMPSEHENVNRNNR
jgi:hypothetical protein